MQLIIGGAYQGKLDFAKRKFNIKDEQVLTCPPDFSFTDKEIPDSARGAVSGDMNETVPDTVSPLTLISSFPYSCVADRDSPAQNSSRFNCINHLENFAMYCVKNNINSIEIFRENKSLWVDSVIICRDIFCGVVPIDAEMRRWREETGHLCTYLSQEADHVYRIFCGLEQQLK